MTCGACPTPHKLRFETKRQAKSARHNGWLKPYLCECGWWHLARARNWQRRDAA